jgi:hypothetical protein
MSVLSSRACEPRLLGRFRLAQWTLSPECSKRSICLNVAQCSALMPARQERGSWPPFLGDNLVPEPNKAMKPPTHAKPYKISMTLLIILGTWGIAIALFYWASFYD